MRHDSLPTDAVTSSTLSKKLMAIMKQRRTSAYRLAIDAETQRSTLHYILHKRANCSVGLLCRLARALHVTPNDLLLE